MSKPVSKPPAKKRVIVSERDNIAALFEGDQAIEFIINRSDILLGDIFLVTVENILPSIDAAFVSVGSDKMGFLHASDTPGAGRGDLKSRLQPKQQLLVQVMKEPTGHKGPRVTSNISLPGRFLVMIPESKGISISRKIEDPAERARLKGIVSLMKPAGVGVIIRTEADEQKESDIQEDFELLLERWQNIVSMAQTVQPPALLYRDQDLLYRVIREVVNEDVEEIIVDTAFGYQRATQLLSNWNMDKGMRVTQYTGAQSIMVEMGVEREIKQALQTKVPLPSGGYLYIQVTEALTVIDVNSGKFTSLSSQAATIRHTNLEAAKEIARQLRLRNIGGMIIVDFIDMESRADKLAVLSSFELELAPDKAKPQVGQLSDLGLVEMTRHRQGQALSEIFTVRCNTCQGTGHAIDDFSWAPPHLDGGDARGSSNARGRNPRLPLKSSKGRGNAGLKFDITKVAQAPTALLNVATKPLATAATEAAPSAVAAVSTVSLLKPAAVENARKVVVPEGKTLAEYYRELTLTRLGCALSSFIGLGYAPPELNGHLSRINPKANSVFSLIEALETGVVVTPNPDDEPMTPAELASEAAVEAEEVARQAASGEQNFVSEPVLEMEEAAPPVASSHAAGAPRQPRRPSAAAVARAAAAAAAEEAPVAVVTPVAPVVASVVVSVALDDTDADDDSSEPEANDDEVQSLSAEGDAVAVAAASAARATGAHDTKRRGRPPKRSTSSKPVKL